MRKCWNWQTGKTKDLVSDTTCGFKSHLPHLSPGKFKVYQGFFFLKLSIHSFFARKTALRFSGRLTSMSAVKEKVPSQSAVFAIAESSASILGSSSAIFSSLNWHVPTFL